MDSSSQSDDSVFQFSHYKPDAWLGKHYWDETQNVPIPSARAKRGATILVWVEHYKQFVGWLLLAHFAILNFLFKTFPDELFWLAWGIFLLEAILKMGRKRATEHFFRGVPCTYVPLNQSAALKSITFFGRVLVFALLAELGLYLPYIIIAGTKVKDYYHDDAYAERGQFFDPFDPFTKARTTQMIIASIVIICLHWGASICNLLAFVFAFGVGIISRSLEASKAQASAASIIKRGSPISPRDDTGQLDRLLCLTWWIHLVRHPFLSASVASAQPGRCGLQGQWFETVDSLKRILEDSTSQNKNVASAAGLWVSQDMAMRALSNLSKHGTIDNCRAILDENGLLLLILIVEEGNPLYCKGLAASTIGTLVYRGCFDGEQLANLADAIPALQKLVRSEDSNLKEMAIGALLNITLNNNQYEAALDEMLASPEEKTPGPEDTVSSRVFVESLLATAHQGSTMRCRVLATGLLACLASKRKVRDAMLRSPGKDYIAIFSRALRSGATLEVKRTAAGVLWELAAWEPKAVGAGARGERCIQALLGALKESGEPSVAAAAAGALARLAMGDDELKQKILGIDGSVEVLVEQLRGKLMWRLSNHLLEVYGIVYNKVQEEAQAQTARVLAILASDNQKNQDLIARKGAIPEIVKLLTVRNPDVQVQAAGALDALCYKNKAIQELVGLYYREAFTNLADLLNPDRDGISPSVLELLLEKAALAVRSLAEGHIPNAEKIQNSGAVDQLMAILERDKEAKFEHTYVCDAVLEALANLKGASRRSSARKSSSAGLVTAQSHTTPGEFRDLHTISQDIGLGLN